MDYCAYRTDLDVVSGTCVCTNKMIKVANGKIPLEICNGCPWAARNVNPDMLRKQPSGTPQITVSGPEIEGPGIVQLGANFGGAVLRQVEAGLKGEERYVTQEEYKRRMEICGGCEFQKNGRCLHKKCGCFLARKNKLSTEHCPLDPPKW